MLAQVVGFLSQSGKGDGQSLTFVQMAALLAAWSKCKGWVVVHICTSGGELTRHGKRGRWLAFTFMQVVGLLVLNIAMLVTTS